MIILLYGALGQKFGRVHRYVVQSPAEALRALTVTLPGFRKALVEGGAYRVLRGGREALGMESLRAPQSASESLRIVPVVQGSRGIGQIILGAVLIWAAGPLGASMAFGGAGAAATSFVTGAMTSIGISLVMSGVSQMLFAPPKAQSVERAENKPSYTFDGAVNTSAQGNPVPVCYGRAVVGSQVISAGLSAESI